MTSEELLRHIEKCDGAEIPDDLWPIAERLVKEGKITLGDPRGPGQAWRRAELVE